ncbi:MAG: hypothetical protein EBU90_01755 [Proteobacteria bacterium]|nr:hypothetical protein [Pseudomonadota bacterium]
MAKKYVYDIESYLNYFLVCFQEYNTDNKFYFELFVSEEGREETKTSAVKLKEFLLSLNESPKKSKDYLIGYNNISYDNVMLNHFLGINNPSPKKMNAFSNSLINQMRDKKVYHKMDKLQSNTIDLMTLGRLDKIGKSLKSCAVNLKMPLIQDLPYSPEAILTREQADEVRDYCFNDVAITHELTKYFYPEIKLRENVKNQYGIDVMSSSRSTVADIIIAKTYCEATGEDKKDFRQNYRENKVVHLKDCILPFVKFETPELQKFLEELRSKSFKLEKGVMKERVVIDGVEYILGIGGIHTVDHPMIHYSTKTHYLTDKDVTSYYPELCNKWWIRPSHLDIKFNHILIDKTEERIKFKKAGMKLPAEVNKIVINAAVGKFNMGRSKTAPPSPLYDPTAFLTVTLSGQLGILMLAEQNQIHGFKTISANTDGILSLVPYDKKEIYDRIGTDWENATRMKLEETLYTKFVCKAMNSYVAMEPKEDGKFSVKTKGGFLYEKPIEKGFDMPIIPYALVKYFTEGIDYRKTIMEHTDLYDFCASQKADSKFNFIFKTIKNGEVHIENLAKTNRYFVSKNGGHLMKKNKDTGAESFVIARSLLTLANDLRNITIKDVNIDYRFYINECSKVVKEIENQQLTLF